MSINETSDSKLAPRTVALVQIDSAGDAHAVALTNEESITVEFNEETSEYTPSTRSRTIVDPTNENPQITVKTARSVSSDALEQFGVKDPDTDEYIRDSNREWPTAELWFFGQDVAIDNTEAETIDSFDNVRWDIGSYEDGGNAVLYDMTGYIEGALRLDTTSEIGSTA
jgi:hypothetical protein